MNVIRYASIDEMIEAQGLEFTRGYLHGCVGMLVMLPAVLASDEGALEAASKKLADHVNYVEGLCAAPKA